MTPSIPDPRRGAGQPAPAIDIPKSDQACIRVARSSFKNHEYIDVRLFVRSESGELVPTRKGITLPPEQVHKLVDALQQVGREAGR